MSRRPGPFAALLTLLFSLALIAAACGDDASEVAAADEGDLEMSDGETADGDPADGGHGHSEGLEVPDGMAIPKVSLTAEEDSVSGHNLFIELENFTVAPERASTDPVDGEGHLHLYIDGERVMRFYNTRLHVSGLEEGEHEVMVEVSANNHAAYVVDGEPIRAMATVTAAAPPAHHPHQEDAALFESTTDQAVELTISEDPKSGWNLFADVGDFSFAPENAGAAAVDGEGHAHLYIDGERVTRLYGPWWHISGLEAGEHEVMVELSANDHSIYWSGGAPVTAMATLTVTEEQAAGATGHSGDDHGDGQNDDGDEAGQENADGHEGDDGDTDGHGHSGTGETLDIAAADADVFVSASLIDNDVTVESRRVTVETGQTVGIIFESDVEEQIHLHGYDILSDVGPGKTAEFSFLADSPGTYEVELEGSGRFLFEIQVS